MFYISWPSVSSLSQAQYQYVIKALIVLVVRRAVLFVVVLFISGIRCHYVFIFL